MVIYIVDEIQRLLIDVLRTADADCKTAAAWALKNLADNGKSDMLVKGY